MSDQALGRRAIHSDKAPAAVGPYSQAVQVGDQLFSSGQIALDPETGALVGDDFPEQARQVFKNLGFVLEAAGMGFADVVRVTIYLADIDDFAELNDLYASHFDEPYPARITLEAGALPKDALIEVAVEAVKRPS